MSLKTLFAAYSTASVAALLIVVIIVNLTGYNEHYLERLEKYERAQLYLSQDICKNNAIKAQLGDYTNCERSKRITQQSVRWLAITDCARDVANWMGFSGAQLTDTQMFKLSVVGIIIVILGVWLGIFRIGTNREITMAVQPLLPSYYPQGHKKYS